MMSYKKLAFIFTAAALLATSVSEAGVHFNFGFGASAREYTYVPVAPVYVERHYYPETRVIVHDQDRFGRPIVSEHVYPGSRREETVFVRPAYRERVRPSHRGFFSIGFSR